MLAILLRCVVLRKGLCDAYCFHRSEYNATAKLMYTDAFLILISRFCVWMILDPFEVLQKQRLRLATVTQQDLITAAAAHLKDSACQGLLVWLKYTPGTTSIQSVLVIVW